MLVRLGGLLWKLTRPVKRPSGWNAGDLGICTKPGRKIQILRSLEGKEELRVILHEARHAQNWDLDEEAVDRESVELTELLWSLGYRKQPS